MIRAWRPVEPPGPFFIALRLLNWSVIDGSQNSKFLIDNFTTLCFDVIRSSVKIDFGAPPIEKDEKPAVEDGLRDPSQIRPRILTPEES